MWRIPAAGSRGVDILQRSAQEVGESLLLPTAAILGAAGLYATLPTRFIAGHSAGVFSVVRWIVPALTLLLLAALWATVPRGRIVKMLMLVESAVALVLAIMVAARAVNILS